MKVRTLSKELQQKAEDELNEVPHRIGDDLNHIREWLDKQPHLSNVKRDDQFLLNFLRGCKYSLEKTKDKLDNYFTLRSLVPEYFDNRDPLLADVQDVLKIGLFWIPLPKSRDPAAPRVIYMRNLPINPDLFNLQGIMKVNFMILDILMNEDDNYNVAGSHLFVDSRALQAQVLMQLTPTFIKKTGTCLRGMYPARSKGLHYINVPSVFESLLRPFLGTKHEDRIFLDSGVNYTRLHKIISPDLLPVECGGTNGTFNDLILEWKNKVESYREWLLKDSQYRSDESKRAGQSKTSEGMFGIEGSFRKLEVD